MPADRVVDDDVGEQLFPEEWREDLERQLKEGIDFACPHCKELISFQPDSDLEEDVKTRRTVTDRLLARGMWVVQINDDECTEEANRKKPFYRVLTLGDDGKIQASTLMPDAMLEFLESSARAAVSAEQSSAAGTSKMTLLLEGVREVLHRARIDVGNLNVPEDNPDGIVPDMVETDEILDRLRGPRMDDAENAARTRGIAEGARTAISRILIERWCVLEGDLDGVPDAELMGIFDDLFNDLLKNTKACIDENDETGKRLVALLGNRATDEDRDPDKTSLQALVDKVWAIHGEFVEAVAAAIDVDLTQDATANMEAIFERLYNLAAFNDMYVIIQIGVALGMNEDDMRRKMLAASTAATGNKETARAELARSVMNTAKVARAQFGYACEAAGVDRQTRDGDPVRLMQALSSIIGENREIAALKTLWDNEGGGICDTEEER